MTGGLYSRVKVWGTTDTLTAADLNAEFDNVLNNFIPQMMSGYSATVGQMQIQTSPGAVGTESLAAALSGELERLRFQIAAITGNTYWYSSPAASISQLVSALGTASLANKIASGLTNGVTGSSQPLFLQPDGTVNTVRAKGSVTPLVYSIAGSTYTISTDVALTSLTTAPATNNTMTVNDPAVDNSARTKLLGENGSVITVSGMGSSISALIGQIAVFKTANATAEYIIGRVESTTQISQVSRGYFFSSANALMGRQTVNNGDTLTLMKLTWIFATTSLTLLPVYTNLKVQGVAPSSPAVGDYWFDTVANVWKTYTGTVWVSALATLIGVCFQDTTKTAGARSSDFFSAYSATNTCELFTESNTEVRSRYTGSQISVYGQTLNFGPDFVRWDTSSNNDSGVTVNASTLYYLYLNTQGTALISDVAPYDRRADLQGYYHPGNTYRCLGTVYSNASTQFQEIESFYRSDSTAAVSTLTAAVTNYPLPYGIIPVQQVINLNGSAGAITQVVPPPYMWKGRYLTYNRVDNTIANSVTLQAWGPLVLTTTGTTTYNTSTITTMASTTGLSAGMLVQGPGIQPGTLITASSASTATIGTTASYAYAGGTYLFANSTGINGFFQVVMAMQGESITLYSDGTSVFVANRVFPQTWVTQGVTVVTASTTAPTKATTSIDFWKLRRANATEMEVMLDLVMSGGSPAIGSGDYLFQALPSPYSIDKGMMPFNTNVIGWAAAWTSQNALRPVIYGGTSTAQFQGPIGAWDATKVRFFVTDNTGSTGVIASVGYSFTTTTPFYHANFKVPVLGWTV